MVATSLRAPSRSEKVKRSNAASLRQCDTCRGRCCHRRDGFGGGATRKKSRGGHRHHRTSDSGNRCISDTERQDAVRLGGRELEAAGFRRLRRGPLRRAGPRRARRVACVVGDRAPLVVHRKRRRSGRGGGRRSGRGRRPPRAPTRIDPFLWGVFLDAAAISQLHTAVTHDSSRPHESPSNQIQHDDRPPAYMLACIPGPHHHACARRRPGAAGPWSRGT